MRAVITDKNNEIIAASTERGTQGHTFFSDSDWDSDKVYSTEKDTGTVSGLHNFHEYTDNHSPWHINDYKHVGRLPLRSYLTTDMEATRKGEACTAVMETAMQLIVNKMKKQYVDSSKGSWHISIAGILQNNATAENIVISCSLVLSLVSETEKIGSASVGV